MDILQQSKQVNANSKRLNWGLHKLPRKLIMASAMACIMVVPLTHHVFAQSTPTTNSAQNNSVQMSSPTNAYECTQVSLADLDPALLTKQERIALLDGSLQDSIDNYSSCVSSVQQNMSGGGAGSGQGDGSEGADGTDESADSTATTDEGLETETPPTEQAITEPTTSEKSITPAQRGVIAPKDNDKIICKLLFKEIQSIDDPDMLKGLKQQYNNYKCG
jgi:hypothetical protein